MRHLFIFSLCVMAFLASESLAGEIREIELDDGSVIRGEIAFFGGLAS